MRRSVFGTRWRFVTDCPAWAVSRTQPGSQLYPGSILFEDVHGVSLADVPTPLEIGELTRLALGLARVVADMHGRGVVHRDISPANIVLAGDGRDPHLIDFALATTSAEIRPDFTHHNRIVGTLAYLAPEQTGRTGRPVDLRADLYALGATLYELATGQPPFGAGDPLRLIHDHLARVPVAPTEREPGRAGGPIGDHHASAGEGAGQPLPERGRAGPRSDPAAAEARRCRCGSASVTIHSGCCRPSRLVGRDG